MIDNIFPQSSNVCWSKQIRRCSWMQSGPHTKPSTQSKFFENADVMSCIGIPQKQHTGLCGGAVVTKPALLKRYKARARSTTFHVPFTPIHADMSCSRCAHGLQGNFSRSIPQELRVPKLQAAPVFPRLSHVNRVQILHRKHSTVARAVVAAIVVVFFVRCVDVV